MPGPGAGDQGPGLRVPKFIYEEILAHCQREYPKEACGILAGRGQNVAKAFTMTNVDRSAISYQMDPKEQLRVMKQMRQDGQEMLAIYHSHTATAASPSPVDVKLAVYPDVSYVLVSLADRQRPQMRSFRIAEGAITPEELQREP